MSLTGVVLGHSFVYGLAQTVHRSLDEDFWPSQVAYHFRVSHHYDNVHLIGQRGAKVGDIMPLYRSANLSSADCVLLDVGSNDLASGESPLNVAAGILHAARRILKDHHVKHVAVCSILYRERAIGQMSAANFQDLVHKTNTYLRTFCSQDNSIHYHTHRGFWTEAVKTWSKDAIHPNSTKGREKYKKSLRRALLHLSAKIN